MKERLITGSFPNPLVGIENAWSAFPDVAHKGIIAIGLLIAISWLASLPSDSPPRDPFRGRLYK